jgi:hypothetical protein
MERQVSVALPPKKTIRSLFSRTTIAVTCIAADLLIFLGSDIDYCGAKCPLEKFMLVYYFFWRSKPKKKRHISY